MSAAIKAKLHLLSTQYCPFPCQSYIQPTHTLVKTECSSKFFSTFWVLVVQQCQSEAVPSEPCSCQTSNNIVLSQVLLLLTSVALMLLPSHTSSPTEVWPGYALRGEMQALPCLVAFTDVLGFGCVTASSIVHVPAKWLSMPGDLACRALQALYTSEVH